MWSRPTAIPREQPDVVSGDRLAVRERDVPFLSDLRTLQAWDNAFPGFEHHVEGAQRIDGKCAAYCTR
jgi:hypothetical protein